MRAGVGRSGGLSVGARFATRQAYAEASLRSETLFQRRLSLWGDIGNAVLPGGNMARGPTWFNNIGVATTRASTGQIADGNGRFSDESQYDLCRAPARFLRYDG